MCVFALFTFLHTWKVALVYLQLGHVRHCSVTVSFPTLLCTAPDSRLESEQLIQQSRFQKTLNYSLADSANADYPQSISFFLFKLIHWKSPSSTVCWDLPAHALPRCCVHTAYWTRSLLAPNMTAGCQLVSPSAVRSSLLVKEQMTSRCVTASRATVRLFPPARFSVLPLVETTQKPPLRLQMGSRGGQTSTRSLSRRLLPSRLWNSRGDSGCCLHWLWSTVRLLTIKNEMTKKNTKEKKNTIWEGQYIDVEEKRV